MHGLDLVQDRATRLLASFLDPAPAVSWAERVRALTPRREDYERVFSAEVAPLAREGYAALWAAPPTRLTARPGETSLIVAVEAACDVGRSPRFPRGYAQIAPLLQPNVPWVCWRLVVPGQTRGTAYDGLVALGERWAWFPRPYRVLRSALLPFTHYRE